MKSFMGLLIPQFQNTIWLIWIKNIKHLNFGLQKGLFKMSKEYRLSQKIIKSKISKNKKKKNYIIFCFPNMAATRKIWIKILK